MLKYLVPEQLQESYENFLESRSPSQLRNLQFELENLYYLGDINENPYNDAPDDNNDNYANPFYELDNPFFPYDDSMDIDDDGDEKEIIYKLMLPRPKSRGLNTKINNN